MVIHLIPAAGSAPVAPGPMAWKVRSMAARPKAQPQGQRGPLYIAGGALLALILIGYCFSDSLAAWFARTATAHDIEGTWVFDGTRAQEMLAQASGSDLRLPAMEKVYGRTVITIAPGTITMDQGGSATAPTACAIQVLPPNGFMVSLSGGHGPAELIFQLETSGATRRLFLSAGGSVVPFKPRE